MPRNDTLNCQFWPTQQTPAIIPLCPQDILANLFKLQIGGQKHWNVYTHSFLQFGLNSARLRMHTKVAEEAVEAAAMVTVASTNNASSSSSFSEEG